MCGIGRPSMTLIASIAPLIYIIYKVTKIKLTADFHEQVEIVLSYQSCVRPPEVQQLLQKNQEN